MMLTIEQLRLILGAVEDHDISPLASKSLQYISRDRMCQVYNQKQNSKIFRRSFSIVDLILIGKGLDDDDEKTFYHEALPMSDINVLKIYISWTLLACV